VRRKHFDPVRQSNPLPVFDRTRTVDIFEREFNGISCVCIQCSCCAMIRNKHACRHIYAVIGIEPSIDHVFPECLKAYETCMFNHDHFTRKCEERTELLLTSGCVVVEGTIDQYCNSQECRGEKILEWYLEAKESVIDVNQNCAVLSVSNYNRNDDSSDGEDVILNDLVPRRTKSEVNAYGHYIKQFTDLCNLVSVTDEEMDKIFDEGFHSIRSKILQYQNQLKDRNKDSTALASFPDISKVRNPRRKRPWGSPEKR
jgi:hypothetical protein